MTAAQARTPFSLPESNLDHRCVFACIKKRGIAPAMIQGFLRAGFLYQDSKCIPHFCGPDQAGKPVFANQRGTYDLGNSGFGEDLSGSDKDNKNYQEYLNGVCNEIFCSLRFPFSI